jgi:hypothetical protein
MLSPIEWLVLKSKEKWYDLFVQFMNDTKESSKQ